MAEPLDYLKHQEITALLKVVHDDRDKAIVTLFLTTGLFLTELLALKVSDINWDNKKLTITGKRPRVIDLNDQAFDALAKWSKERPDSQSPHFFLTTKGKLKELSGRSVDHVLRKYGKQAGIASPVNAVLLRNTFAVRVFQTGISESDAAKLLGISDAPSLKRYQLSAVTKTPETNAEAPVPDTRPALVKFFAKLFPLKPKTAKILGDKTTHDDDVIFGRDHLIAALRASLNKGQSVLLKGKVGLGRTHLLKHMATLFEPHAVLVLNPLPLKAMLTPICEALSPDWKSKLPSRYSIQDMLNYATSPEHLTPPMLFLDNLDKLKASDADAVLTLLRRFPILGATEDTIPRLQELWWKFKVEDLQPLTEDASRQLIRHLTKNMSIVDPEQMETRLLSMSNGYPVAIVDMVKQLSYKPVVTRDAVREMTHEAGMTYRDWSWLFAIAWALIISFRFVALGIHSFEGYILAGLGTGIFGAVRWLIFKGKR